MTTIDAKELVQLLLARKGSKFATITYQTVVELRDRTQKGKRGLPTVEALKVNTVNVQTTFDYVAGVERRLEKEEKSPDAFKKGTSWHQAVVDADGRFTPFAEHPETGEVYFRCQHLVTIGDPVYYIDALTLLPHEAVAAYLPAKRNYENQGLDAPLKFLLFKLTNLRSIKIDGGEYAITHEEVEEKSFPSDNKAIWDSISNN